jgi:ribosome-associated protein
MVAPGLFVEPAALSFTFSRGGGPGGQNVNKVNTHAMLSVPLDALRPPLPGWAVRRLEQRSGRYLASEPARLVIHAADSRSQSANRQACLTKLRAVLVDALDRPRRRLPTRPSKRAKQRRLDAKKHRGHLKSNRRNPEA